MFLITKLKELLQDSSSFLVGMFITMVLIYGSIYGFVLLVTQLAQAVSPGVGILAGVIYGTMFFYVATASRKS